MITALLSEPSMHHSLTDFKTLLLTDDLVLVTYRITKNDKKQSLRSSIWKFNDNQWQMIFHQGRLIKTVAK